VTGDRVVVPADPDRRFCAFATDRALVLGAAVLTAVVTGHPWAGFVVLVAAELALALLGGATGTSPGKAAYGLRLVHTGTLAPVGARRALLRTTVLGLAGLPAGLGLPALAVTALGDPGGLRRGWHDLLVSSIVISTRQAPEEPAEPPPPPGLVNLTTQLLGPPG